MKTIKLIGAVKKDTINDNFDCYVVVFEDHKLADLIDIDALEIALGEEVEVGDKIELEIKLRKVNSDAQKI